MDRLSEEELGRVLAALDTETLLEVPQTCRGLRVAASRSEEEVWEFLLQWHFHEGSSSRPRITSADCQPGEECVDGAEGSSSVGPNDRCQSHSSSTCDASQDRGKGGLAAPPPRLPAKERFRLRGYMQRHQLPSLSDALRCAADHDHRPLLTLLLRAGADPNAAADSGAWGVGFTQVGAFPLHLAAKRGHLDVLDLLLAARADVDAADQNGRTGLQVASASGQAAAAQRLIEGGAAVDAVSDYGYGALHNAALLPRPELVELLLAAGASPHLVDKQGQTPLHVVLNALPRRAALEETSCDPSGYGDEYCYCRNTSHGYGSSEGEPQQERSVRRAAEALLRHGASTATRDDRGRAAADLLQVKCRSDLLPWLHDTQQGVGEESAPTASPAACDAAAPEAAPALGQEAWWLQLLCPASCFSALRSGSMRRLRPASRRR